MDSIRERYRKIPNYQLVYYDAENVGSIGILVYPKFYIPYLDDLRVLFCTGFKDIQIRLRFYTANSINMQNCKYKEFPRNDTNLNL